VSSRRSFRPRPAGRTALLGLVLTTLVACSTTQPAVATIDPAPKILGTPAPAAQVDQRSLPLQLAEMAVVEPGWDQAPEELDGLFLGRATSGDEALQFTATDSAGTLLWQAKRPRTCTGFALSRADGHPIAVLTDASTSAESTGRTTATAYDLATGDQLWGPVDVPGPHQGPGLVFAAPAPAGAMGSTGPRVVLDPASGAVLLDESNDPRTTVIGEYDGMVLSARDGALHARDAASAQDQWTLPLDQMTGQAGPTGDVVALAGTDPPPGTALIGPAERPGGAEATGALIDLSTGKVIATDVLDARQDGVTGVWVVLGSEKLSGYRPEGLLWSRAATSQTRLAAAGGVLVYLRVGDAVQVVNAMTGGEAVAYGEAGQDGFAVPALIASDGTAVVRTGSFVLATDVPAG
jgi:hypothetical protein